MIGVCTPKDTTTLLTSHWSLSLFTEDFPSHQGIHSSPFEPSNDHCGQQRRIRTTTATFVKNNSNEATTATNPTGESNPAFDDHVYVPSGYLYNASFSPVPFPPFYIRESCQCSRVRPADYDFTQKLTTLPRSAFGRCG